MYNLHRDGHHEYIWDLLTILGTSIWVYIRFIANDTAHAGIIVLFAQR